ncbi:Lrp/AsnC family transcriptional regulator [Nonomuraea lactucae]|uniref:Lrp/AsnC family transcriptional regulator n=1 Tax=Nonomuraea lactucae TaxID=2249762 RepID=UPI000DE31829|nr:Lrp/AsnC family transcriptional regulator [Nonomuraea lactucae]
MSGSSAAGGAQARHSAVELDEIDRRIVGLLSGDGRMSIRTVAEQAHISRASAYARLERLRETGVITGFRAVVDPHRYGFPLAAYVAVKLRQRSWKAFSQRLHELPEVEHAALLSAEYDMLLLVRVRDPEDLRDIVLERLHAMPEVVTTQTMFVLDEIRT